MQSARRFIGDTFRYLQLADIADDLVQLIRCNRYNSRHISKRPMMRLDSGLNRGTDRIIRVVARLVDGMHQWRSGCGPGTTRSVADHAIRFKELFTFPRRGGKLYR